MFYDRGSGGGRQHARVGQRFCRPVSLGFVCCGALEIACNSFFLCVQGLFVLYFVEYDLNSLYVLLEGWSMEEG